MVCKGQWSPNSMVSKLNGLQLFFSSCFIRVDVVIAVVSAAVSLAVMENLFSKDGRTATGTAKNNSFDC